MARDKILLVEDERSLTDVLEYNLERDGYEVFTAHEGKDGLRKAQTILPDAVILDLMLPGMSGLEICKSLKSDAKTANIPVLMLTSKSEESDQIVGFAVGADDYVTKPFSTKVLLQRIKALLRRKTIPESTETDIIAFGKIKIDKRSHKVLHGSQTLALTPTEFRLLETLVRQPGRAFSRHDLMDSAIGDGAIVLERTIDVHVKSLRRKLGPSSDFIETVRGIGYRFKESP